MAKQPAYATKKELMAYQNYCEKQFKEILKVFKSWDAKQDKKLLKKGKK